MTTPQRWQEIDRIFAAALEREPAARAAFLNEACAGDELLRQEVESLLANDIPESLVGADAVQQARHLLEKRAGELTVKRIGRYQIIRTLGAGGMGRVYLGVDEQLNRKVAIKLLSNYDASEAERMRRFVLEAQAAAALNHPNIAHVYEISEDHGTKFIAMEYIDGQTLRQKIQGKSDLRLLLKHLLQVAEGLAKAHAAGIVHRDLKPDNIMITRDGHAKILDFGLAKLLEPAQKPDRKGGPQNHPHSSENATAMLPVQHSTPGVVMGTVGYISPEQAQAKPVDQRSDIFSFGCILYEVATGRKPFAGESIIDTLHKIIYEPAPSITDLNPSASPELQRMIRKCLVKEPEKRYQTIRDIANELEELLEEMKGLSDLDRSVGPSTSATSSGAINSTDGNVRAESTASVSQPPVSSAEYIVSGIKQHKLAVAIALLVLVVSAVALGFYLQTRNTQVAIESIAVLPFQNRSAETDTEYLSDGLAESLIYRLSQLPNLKVSPTSSVFRYKGKEIDPIKVGQELGVNAVLSGRIVQRGDSLTISAELLDVHNNRLLWGEQYDRKMSDLLATQREIAREIVDKLKLKVSGEETGLAKHYTESNDAFQLYLKGRFYWNKRTEEGMHKALENFQQAIERDPSFALAYTGLADAYNLLGAQDAIGGGSSPAEMAPKAMFATLKALELDPTLAEGHVSLARGKYYNERDWVGAEREFKRALELNPNYPLAYHWYAIYLMSAGRLDEALAQSKRAQELDPLSLPINMSVGWILLVARRYDESIEQLRKTLEMDPSFIATHHRLGLVYEEQGKYEEAIAEFRQVLNLSPGKPLGIANLAHAYALAGKRQDAQRYLAELLEMSKQRYVSPASIATIYAALGDKDKAFAWLENADKGRDYTLVRLKVDSRYASLRTDSRFADLVRRIGVPQ